MIPVDKSKRVYYGYSLKGLVRVAEPMLSRGAYALACLLAFRKPRTRREAWEYLMERGFPSKYGIFCLVFAGLQLAGLVRPYRGGKGKRPSRRLMKKSPVVKAGKFLITEKGEERVAQISSYLSDMLGRLEGIGLHGLQAEDGHTKL